VKKSLNNHHIATNSGKSTMIERNNRLYGWFLYWWM